MDSALLKYDLLDPLEKKEVTDFIDFLFSKKKKRKKAVYSDYKKKILAVSVWSDDDIKVLEENRKQINQWEPPIW